MDVENGNVIRTFPARVKFREFDSKSNSEGYIKVSEYVSKHSEELLEEAKN